jgi:hypothetical protein
VPAIQDSGGLMGTDNRLSDMISDMKLCKHEKQTFLIKQIKLFFQIKHEVVTVCVVSS